MKATKFFLTGFLLIILFSSCLKDQQPVSSSDPLPFPMEENKDLLTSPGDDFWQYCNGSWYANTPKPESGAVGGLYQQNALCAEIEKSLFSEDPSLHRFQQLSDELYANSAEAKAYLEEWKARYPEPKTREDFFRNVGRMIIDGLPFFDMTLTSAYVEGKIAGVFAKHADTAQYAFSELDDSLKPMARWIAEGMEIAPESLYFSDNSVWFLDVAKDATVDEMLPEMEHNWGEVNCFIDEETNASNEQYRRTPEFVKASARAQLAYEISYRMAPKYVTEELKLYYLDLIGRLCDSFRNRLQHLEWMSETTRNNALDKLDKLLYFAGYPDVWYEDCVPDLSTCKSLLEAVQKLKAANLRVLKHLIGTNDVFTLHLVYIYNPKTNPFVIDLTVSNAFYVRQYNSFIILPAMMLPPIQRRDISEAHVYGIAEIIAHELTHAFDSNGAKYDGYGRYRNWWTVADAMAFKEEQEKLVECYNSLEYDPIEHSGMFTDGRRTLGENIADLGGFLVTLDAFSKRLTEQGYFGEEYTAQLRKFYESFADMWCMKYSDEKLNSILYTDTHSHCRIRTNGVVMNTDLWYELYGVDRNNILYLPPERRTRIW